MYFFRLQILIECYLHRVHVSKFWQWLCVLKHFISSSWRELTIDFSFIGGVIFGIL